MQRKGTFLFSDPDPITPCLLQEVHSSQLQSELQTEVEAWRTRCGELEKLVEELKAQLDSAQSYQINKRLEAEEPVREQQRTVEIEESDPQTKTNEESRERSSSRTLPIRKSRAAQTIQVSSIKNVLTLRVSYRLLSDFTILRSVPKYQSQKRAAHGVHLSIRIQLPSVLNLNRLRQRPKSPSLVACLFQQTSVYSTF